MPRKRRDEFRAEHSCQPIYGGKFTFRTLSPPDARWGQGRSAERSAPMDRLITVTLPAIEGENHKTVACMKVIL